MLNAIPPSQGDPAPNLATRTLIRSLIVERFGSSSLHDFDSGDHAGEVSSSALMARPQRRRYRGWALAAGRPR